MCKFHRPRYLLLTIIITLLIFLSACSTLVTNEQAEKKALSVSNEQQSNSKRPKIVGGRLSADVPWVVGLQLHIPNTRHAAVCTGAVLTNKWILTAGHCFDEFSIGSWVYQVDVFYSPNPGGRTVIYSGPGVFKKHKDRDVAVLFLYRAGGLGAAFTLTGQASVFFDSREPWDNPRIQEDRIFSVLGWGSTRNGTWLCNEGPALQKRMLAPLFINEGVSHDTVTVRRDDDDKMCGGDSGAPWILERAGRDMAFAVYFQTDPYVFPPRPVDRATLIRPILNWFGSASKSVTLIHTLTHTEHVDNGWHYLTFNEVDISPPPACPSGQSCCFYTPKGYCLQCVTPSETCGNNPFRGCGPNHICSEPGAGPNEGCRKCIPKSATGNL